VTGARAGADGFQTRDRFPRVGKRHLVTPELVLGANDVRHRVKRAKLAAPFSGNRDLALCSGQRLLPTANAPQPASARELDARAQPCRPLGLHALFGFRNEPTHFLHGCEAHADHGGLVQGFVQVQRVVQRPV